MLTELDIINSMLRTIGLDGLSSADTDHPDYLEAKKVLDEVHRSVNKLGYWYNTSYPTLAVNSFDEIVLPANTLSSDPCDRSLNYTQRGTKLFDLTNRTYKIGTSVQVKLVENLELDLLPETAKDYIRAKARFDMYFDSDSDGQKLAALERERLKAWSEFYREHIRNRDPNALDSPAAQRIRRGTRTGRYERQVGGIFR